MGKGEHSKHDSFVCVHFGLYGTGSDSDCNRCSYERAQDALQRASGAIIFIFGLHFLGIFKRSDSLMLKNRPWPAKARRVYWSIIFGAAFSLGWSPCLGPFWFCPYACGKRKDSYAGSLLYLFVFFNGSGSSLYTCCGLFTNNIKGVFQWLKKHGRQIKLISGLVLVLAGLMMVFDLFGYWAGLCRSE